MQRINIQYVCLAILSTGFVSCGIASAPALTCPDFLVTGETATLFASEIDDAVIWSIEDPQATGATFVLENGGRENTTTTSVIGDPGFSTGNTMVLFKAGQPGNIIVHIVETMIGPPIGLPRPLGSSRCDIDVLTLGDPDSSHNH